MIGRHNLLNALSVVAVADHLGIPVAALAEALGTFQGIRRRQEIRGEKRGILVMDDFAHHPTAVRETIAAVRSAYPGRRLIAVFEPRTNSSMRKVFQPVYPQSFDGADRICIRKPSMLEKVPEAERFSAEALVAELQGQGRDAAFFADTDSIIASVVAAGRSGDVVLIMSNGGFDNIHERLLEAL
jgi:UDP-N-acetylmuramate: L-alanyl-gamma-D-glutamyl-meso-diaminopimelate ligase